MMAAMQAHSGAARQWLEQRYGTCVPPRLPPRLLAHALASPARSRASTRRGSPGGHRHRSVTAEHTTQASARLHKPPSRPFRLPADARADEYPTRSGATRSSPRRSESAIARNLYRRANPRGHPSSSISMPPMSASSMSGSNASANRRESPGSFCSFPRSFEPRSARCRACHGGGPGSREPRAGDRTVRARSRRHTGGARDCGCGFGALRVAFGRDCSPTRSGKPARARPRPPASTPLLWRISCHGSIRSGRRLRAAEMDALLREMEATPLSGQCNHGRPTYVSLDLADIEKLFGRR